MTEEGAHRAHVGSTLAQAFDVALHVVLLQSVEKLTHSHALLAGPLKACRSDSVVGDLADSLSKESSGNLLVACSSALAHFY